MKNTKKRTSKKSVNLHKTVKNASKKLDSKKPVTVAMVLMLIILTSGITVSTVTGAKQQTSAFVSVSPKTAGFGQYVLINAWVSPPPPLDP